MRKVFFYKTIVLVFAFVSIFFLAKSWQLFYGGFRIDKICERAVATPLEEQSPDKEILALFDQKFYYLGKGAQAFVFSSGDGRYVIKFPRYHKYRPTLWMRFVDRMSLIKHYGQKRKREKERSLRLAEKSYHLAEKIQEETGLLFVHLRRSDRLKKKLILQDRFGKERSIDLDSTVFLLQRRARSFEKELLHLKGRGKKEEGRVRVLEFLEHTLSLYRQGITVSDYHCVKNVGLLDHKVITIDLGSFRSHKNLQDPKIFRKELLAFTKRFRRWLEREWPELVPFFQEKLFLALEEKGC